MYSLKPGRAPSIQKAIGGLVGGLFGVLWTVLAISLTANAPFPVVRIVFPLFGVIISLASFASAAYNFTNATSSQRFAEYDFVSHIDEPDPLNAKLVRPANRSKPGVEKFCAQCGGGLEESFRYCPSCGTKV